MSHCIRRTTVAVVVILALIHIISSTVNADIITVEVTIKAVDATARTVTATRRGKSLELDVSKRAEIFINGEAGELAALGNGQAAKIDFETNLEVVTKIDATGEVQAAPELLVLREINTPSFDAALWFMPDGLTVYWNARGDDGMWIWTATRETPASLFEGKQPIMPGSDPTVTGDGLEMILYQDGKLYSAKRDSADASFQRPRAIAEFSGYGVDSELGRLAVPCVSEDGLTLYMTLFQNGSQQVAVSTRRAREAEWETPRPVEGLQGNAAGAAFVTPDGKMLLCKDASNKGNSDGCGFLVFGRGNIEDPFRLVGSVDCPVLKLNQGGNHPRFCTTTGELFLSGVPEGGTNIDMIVVKNFSPATMIRKAK